jgi:hypothetical protein
LPTAAASTAPGPGSADGAEGADGGSRTSPTSTAAHCAAAADGMAAPTAPGVTAPASFPRLTRPTSTRPQFGQQPCVSQRSS